MRFFVSFIVKFFVLISSWLPRTWLRKSGSWLGFLAYDLFGFRKKIVLNNLNIAFPDWTLEEKLKVGRESVYQLCYSFGEFFYIPSLSQEWLKRNVIFEGWENVLEAQKHGKGILFLSLHLGNVDLAANCLVMNGLDLVIISKKFKTKWFNDLWFSIRGAQGVQYIDAHGANNAFDILKALKRNAGVVFVLDQYMGKPYGIETSFFGKKTGTAYGLGLFAQKTKSPVLPVYAFEGEDGKIHVVVEAALDMSNCLSDDKDKSLYNLTQSFNDKLEEIVRKHPEQWMWIHRRWKDF